MWLGHLLSNKGIRALPSCHSEEALHISSTADYRIELVIVNPDVEGCHEVLEENPNAKVMAIGEAGELKVDGTLQRPGGRSLLPPERYFEAIRKVLASAIT